MSPSADAPPDLASVSIRDAKTTDYSAFTSLFPLLPVNDPTPSAERFASVLVPTTVLAEEDGKPIAYAFYEVFGVTAFVRHVVVAAHAQGRRVGDLLLRAVAARAAAKGATEWCLNVQPHNTRAVRLYERLGYVTMFRARAIHFPWSIVDAIAAEPGDPTGRAIARDGGEDARIEAGAGFLGGTFATARGFANRHPGVVEVDGEVRAAGVFDAGFPGVSPFWARSLPDALALLRFYRATVPDHQEVSAMVEGTPEVTDALLAKGAALKVEVLRMKGPLPKVVSS